MPLLEFLRDGRRLDPVEFGMTADEVRRRLGDPDDVSARAKPTIWQYGGLQLAFGAAERGAPPALNFIGLYFGAAGDRWPDAVRAAGWWPDADSTAESVRQHLTAEGLSAATDGDALRLPSGVRIAFEGDRLHSIQATDRRATGRQQLAVSLPADVYEAVRREASRLQRSVADVCAGWIAERVPARPAS